MNFYRKLVGGCALGMVLVGIIFSSVVWGVSAVATTLLAGYLGVKYCHYVPRLRGETPIVAICVVSAGAVLQGIGLVLGLALVWAVGLFASLVLPMAAVAFDIKREDAERAKMYEETFS